MRLVLIRTFHGVFSLLSCYELSFRKGERAGGLYRDF